MFKIACTRIRTLLIFMQFPSISHVQIPKEFDFVAAENDIFMNPKYYKSPERKRFLSRYLSQFLENGIDISKNKISFQDISEYFSENPNDLKYFTTFSKINSPKLIYLLFIQKTVDSNFVTDIVNSIVQIEDFEKLFYFLEYFVDLISDFSKFISLLPEPFISEFNKFMTLSPENRDFLRKNEICPNSFRSFIKNDDIDSVRANYNSQTTSQNDIKPFTVFESTLSSPLAYASFFKARNCCTFFLNRSPAILDDNEAIYFAVLSGDMTIISLFENAGAHLERFLDAAVESHNPKIFDYIMKIITEKIHDKKEIFDILKNTLKKTRNALFLLYCIEIGVDLEGIIFDTEFLPFVLTKTKKLSFPFVKGPIYFNVLKIILEDCETKKENIDYNELLCRCVQVDSVFLLFEKGAKPNDKFTKSVFPLFDPSERQWISFKLMFL